MKLKANLGLAGMIAPILFNLVIIVLGFFEPGYSHLADPVSALGETGSANPLLQSANFIVLGLLLIALTYGLYLDINNGHSSKIGFVLLTIFAVMAGILPGVFPADEGGAAITFSGQAHQIVTAIGFPIGLIGILFVRREMKKDEDWSDLATYTLITVIVAILLFILFAMQRGGSDAGQRSWSGLRQRLFILAVQQWFFVMGYRLRKLSLQPEG